VPGRILTIALLAGAGYWYWSGPYQDQRNPSYEQKLEKNAKDMSLCIHGKNFQLGATGSGEGNPEEACARKFNLYLHDGKWHSYDDVRREP
jgi:hypothetical protein